MRPILESEGVALLDEGIGGSVTLRNFRSPRRRSSYRRSWFTGSLVVTGVRFAAFQFGTPLINVPLNEQRLRLLDCSVDKRGTTLKVAFDASDFHASGFHASGFHDDTTGTIECRFRTEKARLFLERVRRKS